MWVLGQGQGAGMENANISKCVHSNSAHVASNSFNLCHTLCMSLDNDFSRLKVATTFHEHVLTPATVFRARSPQQTMISGTQLLLIHGFLSWIVDGKLRMHICTFAPDSKSKVKKNCIRVRKKSGRSESVSGIAFDSI